MRQFNVTGMSCAACSSRVEKAVSKLDGVTSGSLTLCLPLDFHNPLQHSPLRLIFLSNFYFFSVLFCTLVI